MKFTRLSSEVKSPTYPVLKEYPGSDYRLVVLFVAPKSGVLIESEEVPGGPKHWKDPDIGTFRSDWTEYKFRSIAGLLEFTGNE